MNYLGMAWPSPRHDRDGCNTAKLKYIMLLMEIVLLTVESIMKMVEIPYLHVSLYSKIQCGRFEDANRGGLMCFVINSGVI